VKPKVVDNSSLTPSIRRSDRSIRVSTKWWISGG